MSRKEEMIMVVPRALFDKLGSFQGIQFEPERYLPVLLARENISFRPRSEMEENPAFKQIIPYVILTHEGRVFHYVRGKKGGEQRLHAKGSIGIGGHMNESDESLFAMDEAAYRIAVKREIEEEVQIEGSYDEKIVALINDDSNEVGKVHLGIVHVFQLASDQVSARESAIAEPGFLTVDELRGRLDRLESWSQICVGGLEKMISGPA